MDAAPAPTTKTTHVATAAEANCLRGNGGTCTLVPRKDYDGNRLPPGSPLQLAHGTVLLLDEV